MWVKSAVLNVTGAKFALVDSQELDKDGNLITVKNKVWNNIHDSFINTNFPYVQQKDNVALVMYRLKNGLLAPIPGIGLKKEDLPVSLHLNKKMFNEVHYQNSWILAMEKIEGKGDNYVAVKRACENEEYGITTCKAEEGQSWVFMVGNNTMYGSFDKFKKIVKESKFNEKWYYNYLLLEKVYSSKIEIG